MNVDLDIELQADPTPLVQAFEPHAYALDRPPGRASFELNVPVSPPDPDPLILEFVRIVRSLCPAAREVWDGALKRVFDIGIQSGRYPLQETHRLSAETLRRAAEVQAEIAITIYALSPDDNAEDAG